MKKMSESMLSFYKDMDYIRTYVIDALGDMKGENYFLAEKRLQTAKSHLNAFLESYDEFIHQERLKSFD